MSPSPPSGIPTLIFNQFITFNSSSFVHSIDSIAFSLHNNANFNVNCEDDSFRNQSLSNDSHDSSETLIYCSSIEDNISLDSQGTVKYSEIKILSLNTGGLRSKVHNPEFEEAIYIRNYDIVCIQETRFDTFDLLDVLGFKCLPLMTTCSTNAKIRSGGIAILVKEHLVDKIKILKHDGDNFYWFTLRDHFAYIILFCVVYIAPEGSNYSDIDCFCSIEQLGFSKERHNSDQSRIDNYGRRLLELCKSCDLLIANGRLGLDRFLGGKTCKCTAVVDYVILSPRLFPYISEFEILPFDPTTSDAHNGLHFSLICNEIEFKQPDSYDQPVSVTRST